MRVHSVKKSLLLASFVCLFLPMLKGTESRLDTIRFFQPSPELHKTRFFGMAGLGLATYSTATVALYNSWYRDFPKTKFHFFNDNKEWMQMDKYGHIFSSYFQTSYSYDVAKWTGLSDRASLWTSGAIALLSQTTIEVMDGFSSEWGFSKGDALANLCGAGVFLGQQAFFKKQYVFIKESSLPTKYSNQSLTPVVGIGAASLESRATDLFGKSLAERALKDYNVQTYWASVDVKGLTGLEFWPSWLNLAFGFGAQNLWGGFDNTWTESTPGNQTYQLDTSHPRYRQYYLSLDLNWRKIRTKSHLINGLLNGLNIFKTPSPSLEYGQGEWRFHLLFW